MTNFENTLIGIILLYLHHCFDKIVFLTKLLFVKLLLAKLNLAKLEETIVQGNATDKMLMNFSGALCNFFMI